MSDNVKVAKNVVICTLRDMLGNGDLSVAGELYDIQSNNLEVLHSHVKVLSNILDSAKNELENELNKNT